MSPWAMSFNRISNTAMSSTTSYSIFNILKLSTNVEMYRVDTGRIITGMASKFPINSRIAPSERLVSYLT